MKKQEFVEKEKVTAKGKGVYTLTKAFLELPEHFALSKLIDEVRAAGGDFMFYVRQLNDICRTEKFVIENIVPNVGLGNIAENMTSPTPAFGMLINEFAVGTGTTPPAIGDTGLETEVYRNTIASRTNAGPVAYLTGFLNATEFDGAIEEAGLFADGDGSPDSGACQSHVAVSTTKGPTETLTMDWTYTLANA